MRVSAREVAGAAMVSEAKVSKDIQRGKLDIGSLGDVVRYVYGNRLLAGGLKVFDGVMGVVAEEPVAMVESVPSKKICELKEVLAKRDCHKRVESGGEGGKDGEFSDLEAEIMLMMIKRGKTRGQAKLQIRKMREMVCAERICEEHMEELGL